MKILRHNLLAGDSNRAGHLKLNAIASSFLLAWATSKLPFLGGASYLAAASWLTIATSCLSTEMIAPPDVDCAEKWSGNELYHYWWKIFGYKVPHRSIWSHSLLFGLPLRMAWALAPLVFLLSGVGFATLAYLEWQSVDAAIPIAFLSKAWSQTVAIEFFRNVAIGAVISDCVHYTLDDFNPIEWVFGDRAIQKFFKLFKPKRKRKNAPRTRKPVATQKARARRR